MKYEKLTIFEPEEIKILFENGELDIDFLSEYISKHNKVYNKLIDIANNVTILKEELEVMTLNDEILEITKDKILQILEKEGNVDGEI